MVKFYLFFFWFVFFASLALPSEFYIISNRLNSHSHNGISVSERLSAMISSKHDHTFNISMIVQPPNGLIKSPTPFSNFLVQRTVNLLNFTNFFVENDYSSNQLTTKLADWLPINHSFKQDRSYETLSKNFNTGKTKDNVLKESMNRIAPKGVNETYAEEGSNNFLLNSPANNLPIKYANLIPKAQFYVAAISGFTQGRVNDSLNAILRIVFN